MYNNSQQTGEYIPSQQLQQFEHQFWGVPSGGAGSIAASGQRLLRSANHPMMPLSNEQQQNLHQTVGGAVPMKRALQKDENVGEGKGGGTTAEEEKENQQPKAKRMHLLSAAESAQRRESDGESGDEEEEEEDKEEEESSRTTKSSSSAENEEPPATNCCYSSSLQHQQSHQSANLMVTPLQRSQPALSTSIGNPLAHSTPYLSALSLNSFQQPPLDYWGGLHQMALVAANKNIAAGGAIVHNHSLEQLTPSSTYYSNLYGQQQQNLMAHYGAGTASGAGGIFSQRTVKDFKRLKDKEFNHNSVNHFQQQGYQQIPFLQHNSSFNNSTYQSRDSGVGGSVKVELKEDGKNETGSSTSGSDESANSAIGRDLMGMPEAKFPPFFHNITRDGQQMLHDLETIEFGMVPPRLALLNCNKKYPITLAEIIRRLGWPEHLNTSYLSGILRKAKNTNAGRELRDRLNSYGCGIDLKTGRRKNSSVTTFTTLCEREAIQMADDFSKLASESFPHELIASEMNRRAAAKCPAAEHSRQRLADVQNTSQILREAIQILQQGIENETLPHVPTDQIALIGPSADRNVLLPTTLNGIKNFSRLSHCFGNRTVMVAWNTLLNVFQKCEQSLGETLNDIEALPGTSNNETHQILLQKIREERMGRE